MAEDRPSYKRLYDALIADGWRDVGPSKFGRRLFKIVDGEPMIVTIPRDDRLIPLARFAAITLRALRIEPSEAATLFQNIIEHFK